MRKSKSTRNRKNTPKTLKWCKHISEHALLRQVQQTKDQLVAMQNSHNMTQSMLSDNTQKYGKILA